MKIDSYIQSKIKRKESLLFNSFTIARISEEPSSLADIKNFVGNGIKKKVTKCEHNDANNENFGRESTKELRYSKEFSSFLETLPNASKILKDTVILPENIFEAQSSLFGGSK